MSSTSQSKRNGGSFEMTSSQDLPNDTGLSQRKRRRFSSKPENESSTDSFSHSNYIPSDSEGSSDSDFEEHPYSRSDSNCNKLKYHSKTKSKRNLNIQTPQNRPGINESKRSKCTSKNAVMARLNRLKKKKYIEDLENKNAELEAENQMLKNMLEMRYKEVESLKRRTSNLESVIRNKTEIGSLLKCIHQHTDLEISSSLLRSTSNNSPTYKRNENARMPSPSHFQEVKTYSSEEEGNEIFNFNANTVGSPLGLLDINGETDINVDISNSLLSETDNWFKPSRFEFPESPESTGHYGIINPSRCETPSKGFAICANDDIGVCFHIANKKVSLEFCDSCNHMASL